MNLSFLRVFKFIDDKFFGPLTLDASVTRSMNLKANASKEIVKIFEKRNRQILVPSWGQNGVAMRKHVTLEFRYNNKLNSKWTRGKVPHEIYPVFQTPPRISVDTDNPITVPVVSSVTRSGAEIAIFYNYTGHDQKNIQMFNDTDINISITIEGKFKSYGFLEKAWHWLNQSVVIFAVIFAIYLLITYLKENAEPGILLIAGGISALLTAVVNLVGQED